MSCLRIDQIYLFLEGELSAEEKLSIDEHISSCAKCRQAVEERRLLIQASQTLPAWEAPPDFTQRIMAKIFPQKISPRQWFITASAGLSSAVLAFFVIYLISGQNLAGLLIKLNHSALGLFQNAVVILAKAAKFISSGIEVILKILTVILKGLAGLTSVLNPELQIILIIVTVVVSVFLLYGLKRKLFAGEKA
jgi:predicted anti-sigma-YlaC factor YlaD